MKKLLIVSNVILLAVICYLAFKPRQKVNDEKQCPEETCYSQPLSNTAFDGIEADLVQKMLQLYKDNHWTTYRISDPNQDDSKWVWFSLTRLKNFINDMERNACKKGCDSSMELGVRFYFVEYPEESEFNSYDHLANGNVNTAFQKRHTLLLVPTVKKDGLNQDFDPRLPFTNCTPSDFSSRFQQLRQFSADSADFLPENRLFAMLPTQNRPATGGNESTHTSEDVTGAMNRGTMGPPPFNYTGQIGGLTRDCTGATLWDNVDGISCTGATINIQQRSR